LRREANHLTKPVPLSKLLSYLSVLLKHPLSPSAGEHIMATFPYFPKNDSASSVADKITVQRQPRTITMEDIAEEMVRLLPDYDPDEVRKMTQAAKDAIIDTLLSGKDIIFDDGTVYSLDEDGRTIWVTPGKNKV
jgi:hypothetical protein